MRAMAARVGRTRASGVPIPPSRAITCRRSPQLAEVVSESVRSPAVGSRRRNDRQLGVPANAIAGGLEPLDEIYVLAGGQRVEAANSPIGPGAEAHVRAVNVL